MSLYTTPSLTGAMVESTSYQTMGVGLTDRVFLVGHCDSLTINDPYQVIDVQAAIVAMNSDSTSPLVRTMLELYYGGARDIWVVAAAPMSEYRSNLSQRDYDYYETYATRLDDTYAMLEQWDLVQIIVPVEAPYYDSKGVDFLNQLNNHCQTSFEYTGNIRLGLMGTRTGAALVQSDVDAMANDPRLGMLGTAGKFVSVFIGEGLINFLEFPSVYTASVIGSVAAEVASLDVRQSIIYSPLSNIMNPLGILKATQTAELAAAKLNPIGLTTLGERGQSYQVVPLTDNTLGPTGTDYWIIGNTRLVLGLIENIKSMANQSMGVVGFGQFSQALTAFFNSAKSTGYFRDFNLNVYADKFIPTLVHVDVAITPYIGVRTITFTTTVGPGS